MDTKQLLAKIYSDLTDAPFDESVGLIYAIRCAETKWVKLGYTQKTVERRRSALQVGCPYPLLIEHVWVGTPQDERNLHAAHHEVRGEGEWFFLDHDWCDDVELMTKEDLDAEYATDQLLLREKWESDGQA